MQKLTFLSSLESSECNTIITHLNVLIKYWKKEKIESSQLLFADYIIFKKFKNYFPEEKYGFMLTCTNGTKYKQSIPFTHEINKE